MKKTRAILLAVLLLGTVSSCDDGEQTENATCSELAEMVAECEVAMFAEMEPGQFEEICNDSQAQGDDVEDNMDCYLDCEFNQGCETFSECICDCST